MRLRIWDCGLRIGCLGVVLALVGCGADQGDEDFRRGVWGKRVATEEVLENE